MSVLIIALLSPFRVTAQSSPHWATNYYDVQGNTIREIRQSMARSKPRNVPREVDAVTEWNVRARYGVAPTSGGYRVTGFNTATTIRITLPRWTPTEAATESIKAAWERYIVALEKHELGHALFARTTAAEIHRRVRAVGPVGDPASLKSQVDSLITQTVGEYTQREREFDLKTNRGINQGVVLSERRSPPPPRAGRDRAYRAVPSDRRRPAHP